jgi:hypothetical protein
MAAESVGVYFMYYILHDRNDEYCIKILKNRLQNGKLKKGGWIVLAESVIPPPKIITKTIRRLTVPGSHECTLED